MSKILSLSLVVAFGLAAMTGCGDAEKSKPTTPAENPGTAAMKSMGDKMAPPAGVTTGDKMASDKMASDKMAGEKTEEPAKAESVGSTTGAGAELPAGDAKKSE